MLKRVALMMVLLLIPALAKADSVWTYQGNALSAPNIQSGETALVGTVLLNSNNQVGAWNFSAVNNVELNPSAFTNFNTIDASFNLFNCSSCAGTPFKGWSISMFLPSPSGFGGAELFSEWNPDTGIGFDYVNNHNGGIGQVWVMDNPGVWTEVVSTPESSSLVSLLSGLAAVGLLICRWKTQREFLRVD
jgi:hypothetical protein